MQYRRFWVLVFAGISMFHVKHADSGAMAPHRVPDSFARFMRVGGDVSGSGKRALGSTHRETDSLECSVETGNAWCGVSEVSYCLESAGDFGVEAVSPSRIHSWRRC